MILDHSRKFVFVHLPKTGGDSFTQAWQALAGPASINVQGQYKHASLQHIFGKSIDRGQWSEYFAACTIRNPFDIVHSDYYFCLDHAQRPNGQHVKGGWGDKLRRVVHYRHFTEFAVAEYGQSRGYWASYCTVAGVDRIDFALRLENIQADFDTLCRTLNLPSMRYPVANVTKDRPDRQSDYTGDARRLVESVFRYELERFGYEF